MSTVNPNSFDPKPVLGDGLWAANSARPAGGRNALIVTVGMAILAVGQMFYQAKNGAFSLDTARQTWRPVVQAAGAVPVWDLAQKVGYAVTTGALKGLAASSLLVALCAGPASCVIEYLYDMVTDEVTREMWKRDWSLMAKMFLKDLLLSATVGGIPNILWNVVFVLSLSTLLSVGCPPLAAIFLTAALVAVAVAGYNEKFGQKAMDAANAYIDTKTDLNQKYEKFRKEVSFDLFLERNETLMRERNKILTFRKLKATPAT